MTKSNTALKEEIERSFGVIVSMTYWKDSTLSYHDAFAEAVPADSKTFAGRFGRTHYRCAPADRRNAQGFGRTKTIATTKALNELREIIVLK